MTHVATETALPELLESVAALRDGDVGPRSLAVLESTVRHGEMSPLHAHDEDEAFRVLEGVLVMHIGAETTRLEPGESIVAPSGVPHALGADSDARYLTTTFARSVRLYEDFVRAVGRPDPDAPSEDAAVVAAIGQANGSWFSAHPACSRARRDVDVLKVSCYRRAGTTNHVQTAIRAPRLADLDLREALSETEASGASLIS